MVGWATSEDPYLRQAPPTLATLEVAIPTLGPGESVELRVPLAAPTGTARQIAWITLAAALARSPISARRRSRSRSARTNGPIRQVDRL